jgi:DHA1 family inner membrane transport protein
MAAHVLCGFAPSFATLMAGRVLAAAAHGCFFGFAIVLATGGVPAHRRATALSIVVGGINIANIVGVPLGTAVGNAFGWRATFLMLAACTLVAAVAIALLVEDTAAERTRAPLGAQVRALMNRMVLGAYGMIVLQMTAVFVLLTFIAPYMDEVAGIGPEGLPGVLLLTGLAGTLAVFAGGRIVDRAPTVTLIVAYPLAAATMAAVWFATPRSAAVGVAAFAVACIAGNIASLAAQHRILIGALKAPELASTLMSTVFNTGIAAGAGLGAWLIAGGTPYRALPLVGVATLTVATLLALLAVLGDRRTATPKRRFRPRRATAASPAPRGRRASQYGAEGPPALPRGGDSAHPLARVDRSVGCDDGEDFRAADRRAVCDRRFRLRLPRLPDLRGPGAGAARAGPDAARSRS